MSDMRDAILQMSEEKHISQEMVLETIKEFVKAAYKRKFGTDENVVISFSDDLSSMNVSAKKIVVAEENYYNEVTEIPLDEAHDLADDVEIGDTLMIPLDPHTFDRGAVQSAKQRAQQSFKDIQNNYTYSEFKNKEGEVIQCYVNSQNQSGDYHMNVGGGVEGVLPVRNQSPRENFTTGESVKCYLERVENPSQNNRGGFRGRNKSDVRIILSRTSPELVRKFLELQVPEIYDHQIEIVKIVRQAGIRTKVAVKSNAHDLDPVGATVGLKGNRIQTIMTELDGEKIDVIQYDENPLVFIANALTPATVTKVLPIDLSTKHAVAIVEENQVGIAIGLSGVNVKLANQLCDWLIEVKTQAQFEEMEITQEAREKAEAIFASGDEAFMAPLEEEEHHLTAEELGISEDETLFADLNISRELVKKLEYHDVYTAEEFFDLTPEEVDAIGLTDEEKAEIASVIDVEEEQEEQFECPNCGTVLTAGTTHCPNCGVEFEFE